jgi:hypothetical protein
MGRHKKQKEVSISIPLQECIECKSVSQEAINDVYSFLELLEDQTTKASKETHYHKLHEWREVTFRYVRKMLDKYKFINAGTIMGIEQMPDANFWWKIYSLVSNVTNSPNLKSDVPNYYSSAWHQNEALIIDTIILINKIEENNS